MRPAGHPRRHRLRRFLKDKVVWPVLDAGDVVLRRNRRRQLYAVHHPSRRVRIRWALLDAWDALAAPFSRMHLRARARARIPAAALGVLMLAGTAGVAYAALSDDDQGSRPGQATQARPAPSPPRIQVGGVIETSEARAERRARARRERAAAARRAARRRAARRRAAREAPAAPAPAPAAETPPAPEPAEPPATPTAPPTTLATPPASEGGGGTGEGDGTGGGGVPAP